MKKINHTTIMEYLFVDLSLLIYNIENVPITQLPVTLKGDSFILLKNC